MIFSFESDWHASAPAQAYQASPLTHNTPDSDSIMKGGDSLGKNDSFQSGFILSGDAEEG